MFYNRMTKKKVWPPADWPEFGKYQERLDIDAFGDGISTHQLDLYYADETIRNHKLLIDIHGGGYIANTRKMNYGFASVFLDKGYDVALLDYPLNDGVQDIIDEVRVVAAQFSYLHSHAEDLGLNPDEFYLTGDSAGGHLALLLAEMTEDAALAAQICGGDPNLKTQFPDFNLNEISLKGVLLNCPIYDLAKGIEESPLNAKGKTALFGPSWKDEAYVALISPRTHIANLKTPVFLSSCRNDFLKEHSELLVKDLKAAGKSPTFIYLDEKNQTVTHVHNVNDISLKESQIVNNEMDRFMR